MSFRKGYGGTPVIFNLMFSHEPSRHLLVGKPGYRNYHASVLSAQDSQLAKNYGESLL